MAAFVAAPAAAAGLTAARGGAFTASTRPACSVAAAAPARRTLAPRMYGPPASTGSPPTGERSAKLTDPERRPGSLKGFVNEMRMVAMKLHTKDQAKEGMQEKSTLPITEWKYVLRPAPLFFFFSQSARGGGAVAPVNPLSRS